MTDNAAISPQPAKPAIQDSDFKSFFESGPGAYLVLTPDLVIVAVSDAYLRLTRAERDNIVGRNVFAAFPSTADAGREHALRRSFESVVRNGVADTMDNLTRTFAREDGAAETRHWSPLNSPVMGPDGSVAFIVHRLEDGTDLVQLRASGAQLEIDLKTMKEPARAAAAEYRRALRDYTQLVRHRIANPLTALTAGVVTLRDLDARLSRETRLEILDSMIGTAERLEKTMLYPQVDDGVERGLHPVPHGEVAGLIEIDAVKSEQHSRDINQKMATQLDDSDGRVLEFFCECWADECTGTITMPLIEFFSIHRREDQFIILPGQYLPSIEDVIDRSADRWIVRKTPEAIEMAE